MTDRKRPDEILDAVADLPPGARDARLAELCRGDRALHDEIASLLEALEAAGDFLENTADLDLAGPGVPLADLAGTTLGPWRLHERLGSGGTGDVWLATRELEGAEQRVALKILRTATILAPDAMRRFRTECRVLALLDHPHIARLVEGAVTPDGVPYLAVEYVEGLPLDAWCDQQDLDVRARLALLIDVCLAVRHLHRHSVIHRDLKPSNILVGRDGRVKIIDFGIARVLDLAEDDADLTVTGLERMTPRYASPEQLRGDPLTTASDVYSLGVVAYRLLTGRMPYAGRRRHELEREITGSRPVAPSAAAAAEQPRDATALRGDLDTIVLTALRREPERRYPSIEAFREDLQRYLEGRPVRARGDSFGYVAGKFVRRHRAAVAAAALALLVLVGATVTGFGLYGRAERARVEAEEVGGFLAGILATADPSREGARPDVTVREALDAAARRIDEDVPSPAAAAALHLAVADAYRGLGLTDEADRHYGRVEELGDAEQGDRALLGRGLVTYIRGDYAAAESLLTLVTVRPDAVPATRVEAHLALSRIGADLDRLDDAARHGERAADLLPDDADPALDIRAVGQLGIVRRAQGDYAAAESLMTEALRRARATWGDAHLLVGENAQNLGVVLEEQGRLDEAIARHGEALRSYRAVLPPGHPEFAVTLTNLADVEAACGRHEDALARYAEARAITAEHLGTDHLKWALVTNGMAVCEQRLGRLAAADSLFRRAHAVIEANLGADHPWAALARSNRARLRLDQGRSDEARALATTALLQLEASLAPDNIYLGRPLSVLSEVELAQGRPDAAAAHVDRLEGLVAALPAGSVHRLSVGLLRARCRAAAGDGAGAAAVLDSLDAALGPDAPAHLTARVRETRAELAGD